MFTVALTGEIGAGKSTIARVWRDLGASVLDADIIAKDQWSDPEIMAKIKLRWGNEVEKDGVPDFKKIAENLFSNDEEYKFATGLIHPVTIEKMAKMARSLNGWVVVEIPLLFESGWFDLIDCVICVTTTDELKVSRNMQRGWTTDEIARREAFLIGSSKKQAMSDMVLCNIGSIEAWEARAKEIGELMLKMSSVHELKTICPDRENAERIAEALVSSRLVASVDFREIQSIYRWKGHVKNIPDWSLECFTTLKNLRPAMMTIRQNHSYEQPILTATEVLHADFATLKWIVESCE
jgi:dephospho-CoA kinase